MKITKEGRMWFAKGRQGTGMGPTRKAAIQHAKELEEHGDYLDQLIAGDFGADPVAVPNMSKEELDFHIRHGTIRGKGDQVL